MNIGDLILVSVDDHLIEPPDVFDNHLPAKYLDRAPKLVPGPNGVERWVFQDMEIGSVGLNAVASWPKEEWSLDPVGMAEMRPGCYDVHHRVRDMDAAGILMSMCFPTMGGFSGRAFNDSADKELTGVVISAYNDWHIDEWCGAYPGRFIPLGVLPLWDVDACIAELRRLAAKGVRAVTFPETPYAIGLPSFQSGHWDPLLKVVSELGVVLCLHIGLGIRLLQQAPDSSVDNFIVIAGQISAITASDLLLGPTLRKFPDLRIALSEGGIGWIPFFLDRADRHHNNQVWTGNRDQRLPSEVFKEHVLACFITDPSGLQLRQQIGVDNIAWECDYPHSDSNWPHAAEELHEELWNANATDEEIHKITWQNSCRFFGVDPFATVPREQATVAALRAGAADVDTSEVSRRVWRERFEAAQAAAS
ncbi:amidohydrolase family protein [Mycobacterium stomatepiae]|uniref:Amidohydrolase n=1 Tax=Mycobacterium stomatepiae TaxID=470076 RepID=A0A7I7Q7R7_9MYCO|nr:amidohydrolase family protein [Mycobacterium stomatepiae]MCV7163026.1 amidohydrolase [Mycobacterium stomatepiae]BBY22171.1 amidohydrolase [Mycobacterium stomatepiae]